MKTSRIAWTILGVSMAVDFLLTAGGGIGAAILQAEGQPIVWSAIGAALGAAGAQMLRTLQTELRAVGIKLSDLLRDAIVKAGGPVPPSAQ